MAGRNIKGITIEIDGNTSPLSKALEDVNKDLKTTQSNLRDIDKLLKFDPGNTTLLKQKQEQLNKAIEDTKKKLDTEKEALAQLKNADQTPEVKAQMEALERQIADDEQKLKSLQEQSKEFGSVAKQKFEAVGGAMQELGAKVQEVGEKVTDVGENITKNVTGPIMAASAAAVGSFTETDKALDVIVKKTGATGEEAQAFGDIMNDIATTIPTGFDDAANAIGEINTRFGVTGDDLQTLSEQFIKFSQINNTDVSTSVDNVQSAMAAFGMDASEAGTVLDILTKAGQTYGVSVDKLSSDIMSNATAFKEMGFDMNSAAGFLASLDKNGVDASSVMTGLKKALTNATKEGKSMDEALSILQSQMRLARTDTEAAQYAMDLFGNKAGPAIAQAVSDGRLSFDQLSNSITDFGGTVDSTFEETLDPITSFQTTMNETKVVLAEVGSSLLTTLQPVIQKIIDVVQMLREKWEALSPATQEAITKALMIAAAVGPVIMLIGKIITGIGTLISVGGAIISGIGTVIGVLGGPLTAAIAAIIAIGVLVWKNWDKICEWAQKLKETVVEAWNNMKEKVSNIGQNISNAVKNAWNGIKNNVSNAMNAAKSTVSNALGAMKNAYQNAGGGIKGIVSGWMAGVKSIISSGFDVINSLTGGRLTAIKDKFVNIFNNIKNTVSNVIEKIKGIFNFNWTLPKMKTPHFAISPPGWKIKDLLEGTIPKLSIEWYKKAYASPVMFNQPTVLPTMSGLMGFGDGVGGEIVVGQNLLTDMIQTPINQLTARVDRLTGMIGTYLPEIASEKEIYLNGRELTRGLKTIGVAFNG